MTLEYDTEMLVNIFLSDLDTNSKINCEEIKKCLNYYEEIHPDFYDLLHKYFPTTSCFKGKSLSHLNKL